MGNAPRNVIVVTDPDALAAEAAKRSIAHINVLAVLTSSFKPKSRLEAENVALRHQLN